ncbi:MAG TPA: DUF5666 domain-containing protein [Terriglobia bacterium]|nr:DUF5666 domain-containing protein [Terriglobia bacterium]
MMMIRLSRFGSSTILAMTALSLLACASSPVLGARPPQGQGTNFNLEGKITDRSPGSLTVNMQGNIIMHVSYDTKTDIRRKDGSAGSAKDLIVGAMIKVEGNLNSSGVVEAHQIDLE